MIIDITNTKIKACAQFQYKGWTVSMSTIFKAERVEVLIWKNEEEDYPFHTVELAIDFINSTNNK